MQVGNGTTAPGLPLKPAFEDIGGYTSVKAALNRLIVSQFSDRASAVRLGVQPTSGVLLSGPTGCGKTLFARQIATAVAAFGVSFLAIKPTEVFSKYLGDSEKTLRVRILLYMCPCQNTINRTNRFHHVCVCYSMAGRVSSGAGRKSIGPIH